MKVLPAHTAHPYFVTPKRLDVLLCLLRKTHTISSSSKRRRRKREWGLRLVVDYSGSSYAERDDCPVSPVSTSLICWTN